MIRSCKNGDNVFYNNIGKDHARCMLTQLTNNEYLIRLLENCCLWPEQYTLYWCAALLRPSLKIYQNIPKSNLRIYRQIKIQRRRQYTIVIPKQCLLVRQHRSNFLNGLLVIISVLLCSFMRFALLPNRFFHPLLYQGSSSITIK